MLTPVFLFSRAARRGRAFTLVELLVSISILVLLVGILFGIFNATATGWQRSETRADAYREARAALALMARDISLTIVPPLPANPNAAGAEPLAPALVLAKHPDDTANRDDSNEELHCLTTVPNSGPGALCAVSYSCRWDDTRRAFSLRRIFADSATTFDRLSARPRPSPEPPVAFNVLFLPPPQPPVAPLDQNDLAAYIWDLQFRIPTDLDAAPPAPAPRQDLTGSVVYGTTPRYPDRLPPYVEIRFKALSTGAGARLRGLTSVTKATWTQPDSALYRSIILPSAQQFVQRVPLTNFAP